jgi:hypothetical protein
MKRNMLVFAVVCAMVSAVAAWAADQPAGGAPPEMPKPGAESKALAPFFGKGGTWTGKVSAGAYMPGSPEMTSKGKAVCHEAMGGFCYMCDVEETTGSGKQAMTWKGHMVVGYDMNAKAYHSFTADNMGALNEMDGTLDGNKFVLTTKAPITVMGQTMDDRLSWEHNSDGTVTFTDEHRPQGGDWALAETSVMHPPATKSAAKSAAKPAAPVAAKK